MPFAGAENRVELFRSNPCVRQPWLFNLFLGSLFRNDVSSETAVLMAGSRLPGTLVVTSVFPWVSPTQGAMKAAGFMERVEHLLPTKAVAIAAVCLKNGFLIQSRYFMCTVRVK